MYDHMYACMSTCMYEHMYVCTYVYKCMNVHECMYVCMYEHMYVCMYACMSMRIYEHICMFMSLPSCQTSDTRYSYEQQTLSIEPYHSTYAFTSTVTVTHTVTFSLWGTYCIQ